MFIECWLKIIKIGTYTSACVLFVASLAWITTLLPTRDDDVDNIGLGFAISWKKYKSFISCLHKWNKRAEAVNHDGRENNIRFSYEQDVLLFQVVPSNVRRSDVAQYVFINSSCHFVEAVFSHPFFF